MCTPLCWTSAHFRFHRTEVKIISQHADEIREAIFSQLDRGVTILHGEGGYSRNSEQVLLSVVSNRQLPKLEKSPT